MKKIYIIRHCQPEQDVVSRCISQTELLLNEAGYEQAYMLEKWFRTHPVQKIYTSPLLRCKETAALLAEKKEITIRPELTEVSVGDWEGYTFADIKKKWPEEYEERGKHLGTAAPPGGESFVQAGERLSSVLEQISREEAEQILIVTHAGVIRGWLCTTLGTSPDDIFSFQIPYGSITEISWEENMFKVNRIGYRPWNVPGPSEIDAFFEKCQTPLEIQKHGYAVAKKAMEIAAQADVDRNLLYAGGVLHDMCRTSGLSHPEEAAKILKKAGYTQLAQIVQQHHDLSEMTTKEGQILYLADKMIMGTKAVTLEERFLSSRRKCKNIEAVTAWKKRYVDAKRLLIKYSGRQEKLPDSEWECRL